MIIPHFNYDEEADVMYISFGEPLPCESKEMGNGILHRYTLENELNGITIINYSKRIHTY